MISTMMVSMLRDTFWKIARMVAMPFILLLCIAIVLTLLPIIMAETIFEKYIAHKQGKPVNWHIFKEGSEV